MQEQERNALGRADRIGDQIDIGAAHGQSFDLVHAVHITA